MVWVRSEQSDGFHNATTSTFRRLVSFCTTLVPGCCSLGKPVKYNSRQSILHPHRHIRTSWFEPQGLDDFILQDGPYKCLRRVACPPLEMRIVCCEFGFFKANSPCIQLQDFKHVNYQNLTDVVSEATSEAAPSRFCRSVKKRTCLYSGSTASLRIDFYFTVQPQMLLQQKERMAYQP